MVKQVSIFAENTKGALLKITEVVSGSGVNIYSCVTNDSGEYGVVRMIVDNPDKAVEALANRGYQCRESGVIGIKLSDETGKLKELFDDIHYSNININYIYTSFDRGSGQPVIIVSSEDGLMTEACLKAKGYETI